MHRLPKILTESIKSTSQKPSWWILALVQVFCLVAIFRLGGFLPKAFFLAALGLLVLPVATTGLWLDVAARHENRVKALSLAWFFLLSGRAANSLIFCIVTSLGFKTIGLPWVLAVVFSSLLAGTGTLAALYSVLFKQEVFFSWTLALDAWRKKVSLAAIFAFCIILAQGAVFYLSEAFSLRTLTGEFSVFAASATIWLLFAVFVVIVGFFAALLNCFLVILFLEIIRPIKEAEEEKLVAPAVMPTVVPESNI